MCEDCAGADGRGHTEGGTIAMTRGMGIQHSSAALTQVVRSSLALTALVLALPSSAGAQSDDTTGFTLGLGAFYIFEVFDQPGFDNR